MRKEDVLEILSSVSFAPSNLDMGWQWDVKETKIYDGKIVVERGYSIRTTFMRPDANTGEIEMGYGRWMYIPENVSRDGLVKTAWLCAELVVKHELMEAFLYDRNRIFDPHKSLSDLQYNARIVGEVDETDHLLSTETNKKRLEESIEQLGQETEVEEISEKEEEVVEDLSAKIHQQNVESHKSDIKSYLDKTIKSKNIQGSDKDHYELGVYKVTNSIVEEIGGVVTLSDSNGKVLETVGGENYTESNVKEMIERYLSNEVKTDPSEVNVRIMETGFSETANKNGVWFYKNPNVESRYILHSETDREFGLINEKGDVLAELSFSGDEYTMDNLERIFQFVGVS